MIDYFIYEIVDLNLDKIIVDFKIAIFSKN